MRKRTWCEKVEQNERSKIPHYSYSGIIQRIPNFQAPTKILISWKSKSTGEVMMQRIKK